MEKKLQTLTVKIDKELLKEFKIKATENNTKMTELIRNWIKEYIKNNK